MQIQLLRQILRTIKFDESDVMIEKYIITEDTQSFVLCPRVGCAEACKVNIKEEG